MVSLFARKAPRVDLTLPYGIHTAVPGAGPHGSHHRFERADMMGNASRRVSLLSDLGKLFYSITLFTLSRLYSHPWPESR